MLITERLVLRQFKDSDCESLYNLAKNPNIGYMCGWNTHKDIEESKVVIENVLKNDYTFAITLKDDTFIGVISKMPNGKSNFEISDNEVEIGFWIGEPFWGNGYVVEAAKIIISHCFYELGISKIWCAYWEKNEKSKIAQEKIGFKFSHTNKRYYPILEEYRTENINSTTKETWRN